MLSTAVAPADLSLGTLSTREWLLCREMTTRRLALGAARLMLQQHLWGSRSAAADPSAQMSVFEALCLAAGGLYHEDGRLAPPDEPEAAALLTRTCRLLAQRSAAKPLRDEHEAQSIVRGLHAVSADDHIAIQNLLATVYNAGS